MLAKLRFLMGLGVCLLAAPLAQAAPAPAPAAKNTPPAPVTDPSADWVSHDISVRFRYLPKRYSCDDLWDRVHDLLVVLGARQDMNIGVSECERGTEEYSPRVRLQFATPSVPTTTDAGLKDRDAAPHTLRLAPGHVGSWTRDDCELMRQLKDQLLTRLSSKIVAFSLACGAPFNSERYSVIVQAVEQVRGASHVAVADARSTLHER